MIVSEFSARLHALPSAELAKVMESVLVNRQVSLPASSLH